MLFKLFSISKIKNKYLVCLKLKVFQILKKKLKNVLDPIGNNLKLIV